MEQPQARRFARYRSRSIEDALDFLPELLPGEFVISGQSLTFTRIVFEPVSLTAWVILKLKLVCPPVWLPTMWSFTHTQHSKSTAPKRRMICFACFQAAGTLLYQTVSWNSFLNPESLVWYAHKEPDFLTKALIKRKSQGPWSHPAVPYKIGPCIHFCIVLIKIHSFLIALWINIIWLFKRDVYKITRLNRPLDCLIVNLFALALTPASRTVLSPRTLSCSVNFRIRIWTNHSSSCASSSNISCISSCRSYYPSLRIFCQVIKSWGPYG